MYLFLALSLYKKLIALSQYYNQIEFQSLELKKSNQKNEQFNQL